MACTGTNALVVLGLVLLVSGGIGFVYGQMLLQDHTGSDDEGGAVLGVSIGDGGGDGDGNAQAADRQRLIRLAGLVVGAVGAVVALVGGMVE